MTPVRVESGIDAGLAWHYGDPLREQRGLDGVVDLSNRAVVRVTGPDRGRWLREYGTAWLGGLGAGELASGELAAGETASYLFLDTEGFVRYGLAVVETGAEIWGWTEPGQGEALAAYLAERVTGWLVGVEQRPDQAVVWSGRELGEGVSRTGCLGGVETFVTRRRLAAVLRAGEPAGLWAYTARRIAAGVPRLGVDTDDRTSPAELGAVGGETTRVARTAGTRRLVRAYLDGSDETWPAVGVDLCREPGGVPIGRLGSTAYHHELGLIGLGLVDRTIADGATVWAGGVPATVESVTGEAVTA